MKLLYHGALWPGSTAKQRFEAFRRVPNLTAIGVGTNIVPDGRRSLWERIRWRLRWPVDASHENVLLLKSAARELPNIVMVDSSRVIRVHTLRALRRLGVETLVYYSPDDIMAAHNLSGWLKATFPEWDCLFTTKTFNVNELKNSGVRRPVLIGNAYDATLHKPLAAADVGSEFETFDLVFIGTFEPERCESINQLSAIGQTVVVYGNGWRRKNLHHNVVLRPPVYDSQYTTCMHHGKLALCFLRKINRDLITTRTIEIAAMGRPMLAERTVEHDAHFVEGVEYLGFSDDDELAAHAKDLLSDPARRDAMGLAARHRCIASGYSTDSRALEMIAAIWSVASGSETRQITGMRG